MADIPLMGSLFRILQCIPVDRLDPDSRFLSFFLLFPCGKVIQNLHSSYLLLYFFPLEKIQLKLLKIAVKIILEMGLITVALW